MIHGKSKDRVQKTDIQQIIWSYLLLKLLEFPQPCCLATCPKASTESPRQEFGASEQASGRQFAVLQMQHGTDRSLGKH